MFWSRKRGARRQEIRKNRPDSNSRRWAEFRASGRLGSLWVAAGFCIATICVMMMRENVVPYRPGEFASTDILARSTFRFADNDKLAERRRDRRVMEPRVYIANTDVYERLRELLVNLPQRVAKDELPGDQSRLLDAGSRTLLEEYAAKDDSAYRASVEAYIDKIRGLDLIILPDDQRSEELKDKLRWVAIQGHPPVRAELTFSDKQLDQTLSHTLLGIASPSFMSVLAPKIVALTIDTLKNDPTYTLDMHATLAAQEHAAATVPLADAEVIYNPKDTVVPRGEISTKEWQLLRAENDAYLHQNANIWRSRAGTAATMLMLTIVLSAYIARYQPRVVRNHARGIAVAGLLLLMLLLAQIAGIGSSPTYVFGIAPTIVVAMILTIAYDQRFAVGVASIHAAMVTLALNETLSFFLVLWAGVLTCCFLLDEIRTRSKLIEVGGATAVALILASFAASLMQLIPLQFMFRNGLYAGAAGLGVGFVVLGILPFVEKTFKITTSMTLLELADASQPLMRRLALEAPGTYNHSLQVATLSEEAAEAIGADSLLCRIGSYYHDIGKVPKADYFVENQSDGLNRHMGITPDLSYKVIISHVKDGVAMAKEYGLPTKLILFIEQHHGTTLVEYFYHQACNARPDGPKIAEYEFRYPGPKPKSKEIAIVMLADCVESATRAMTDPTSSRIEALVHELAMKRLLDGQFDECDLTMRDVELVERSLAKTLQSFYHGRIAYPSKSAGTPPADSSSTATTRTA